MKIGCLDLSKIAQSGHTASASLFQPMAGWLPLQPSKTTKNPPSLSPCNFWCRQTTLSVSAQAEKLFSFALKSISSSVALSWKRQILTLINIDLKKLALKLRPKPAWASAVAHLQRWKMQPLFNEKLKPDFKKKVASTQCDQIGRFLKVLGDKFSYKSVRLSAEVWKHGLITTRAQYCKSIS